MDDKDAKLPLGLSCNLRGNMITCDKNERISDDYRDSMNTSIEQEDRVHLRDLQKHNVRPTLFFLARLSGGHFLPDIVVCGCVVDAGSHSRNHVAGICAGSGTIRIKGNALHGGRRHGDGRALGV